MKSTGIVRRIDELGRVVIPKELRTMLSFDKGDPIEIYVDGEEIILKKYTPYGACVLTGEVSHDNFSLGNGNVVLSKEGAEMLLKELEQALQTSK
ncbi:AbrB/MazE/SpoVT family DNA-binding domain-containing protein [Bacillus sp. CGMCC 1.16541]|uniref:AbrB/MazE/SpoVT family DNA-binding domain-containing protein n=1 Tax=Bacillus sp. CGMCC 1.16541 TaxID=2185143 RepID=UPI000D73ED2A|nr:AbrB/MazE/SpoVT family DNA-binding domain-containing protein [Bacillus sp. CGMCC 1.16541]